MGVKEKVFNEIGIVKCSNCNWIGWEGELIADENECPNCMSNEKIKWIRTIKIEPYISLQEVMKEIETVEKENRGTKFYMLVTFKIWNRFKKQLLGDNILKEKRLD